MREDMGRGTDEEDIMIIFIKRCKYAYVPLLKEQADIMIIYKKPYICICVSSERLLSRVNLVHNVVARELPP